MMDSSDSFCENTGNFEDFELSTWFAVLSGQLFHSADVLILRYGVGDDDFIEARVKDAIDAVARENAVRDKRVYFRRAFLL